MHDNVASRREEVVWWYCGNARDEAMKACKMFDICIFSVQGFLNHYLVKLKTSQIDLGSTGTLHGAYLSVIYVLALQNIFQIYRASTIRFS